MTHQVITMSNNKNEMVNNHTATRKVVLFIIKIGVSVALIFWLIKHNKLNFIILSNLQFDFNTISLLCVGTFFVICALLLLGYRLWLFIRFKMFHVSFWKVFALTLVGSFWSVILPGVVGGDAVKAIYLCSNVSERRMDVLTAVFIDRVIGFYSLLLLGTLVLIFALGLDSIPFNPTVLLVAPTIVVVASIGMVLVMWNRFFNLHSVQYFYLRAPKKIQYFIKSIREYFCTPSLIMIAIILSIANHVLVVGSFIIAALLLHNNIPLLVHFIINPLAMVMNIIPLTPGGIGITESAFSFLFDAAGYPNGAMVGLLGRFIQYIVFIVSGSIAMPLLKMRSTIHAMNHEESPLCL